MTFNVFIHYSVLNASTGFFFAAILDGMILAISVSTKLRAINPIDACAPNEAVKLSTSNPLATALLIGIDRRIVTTTPTAPEINPINPASAIKILVISFLRAPIARKIPISFVLSTTDTYVSIPFIIDDTISEIPANADKINEIVLIICDIIVVICFAISAYVILYL